MDLNSRADKLFNLDGDEDQQNKIVRFKPVQYPLPG